MHFQVCVSVSTGRTEFVLLLIHFVTNSIERRGEVFDDPAYDPAYACSKKNPPQHPSTPTCKCSCANLFQIYSYSIYSIVFIDLCANISPHGINVFEAYHVSYTISFCFLPLIETFILWLLKGKEAMCIACLHITHNSYCCMLYKIRITIWLLNFPWPRRFVCCFPHVQVSIIFMVEIPHGTPHPTPHFNLNQSHNKY